jgi:hypothetical protein
MKTRSTLALALACLAVLVPSIASAFHGGDWVLARWHNGPYWFPGVVQSHSRGMIRVRYDDGTYERLPERAHLVKPYDWHVGSRIECQWSRDKKWYAGHITSLNGPHLVILYDDGTSEGRPTGKCRSN